MKTETRTHLADLFSLNDLRQAIEDGYVRQQFHPDLPLRILNYTERCQFERAWTEVTKQCRGLIVTFDGFVVARAFAKFFNYGEHPDGSFDLAAPAEVTNKLDGSLAISYPTPRGLMIATRGSFLSPQAAHASMILRARYPDFTPPDGMTVLWEVIYPANRIVVDYGDTNDLYLLGAVNIETGASIGPDQVPEWTGPKAESLPYPTLAAALAADPRPNAEGMVVHFPLTGQRVKIKQADYMRLHRLLTRVTARDIWEFLAVHACKHLIDQATPKHWGSRVGIDPARADVILALGDTWLDQLVDRVPDEFHAWVRDQIACLIQAVDSLGAELEASATAVLTEAGIADPADRDSRKTLAAVVGKRSYSGEIYRLIDGRDITTNLWRQVYPEPSTPFADISEDVA